ncbi:MAG: PolC-type DNA polymerase III [Clostridia bacterium]|nr:PolC-type DNA polymerase III [Clostridia bacterium]
MKETERMHSMADGRTLATIFSRYKPVSAPLQNIIDSSADARLSGDREKKIYEVRFSLPFIAKKDDLYKIEKELCDLYELSFVRLLPNYPKELFSLDYMGEIYIEAKRVGAVTHGFFDDCQTSLENGVITISVNYSQGGVELLDLGRAGEIVSGIIRSEFGLNYKTVIQRSDEYERHRAEYLERQAAFLRRTQEQAVEYNRIIEERRRQEEAAEAAKKAQEAPQYKRIDSLFEASEEVDEIEGGVFKSGRMTFDTNSSDILYGEEDFEISDPTALRMVKSNMRSVTVLGKIFKSEAAEIRNSDNMSVTIGITDNDSSVFLKLQMPAAEAEPFAKSMKSGMCIAAVGSVRADKFGEYNVSVKGIKKIKWIIRKDNAPVKRVELHCHTNLSSMDAIPAPADVVKRAAAWGHKAIAITDHGNAQGFPTAMLAAEGMKDNPIKVIYGIEAYFVDDTRRAVFGHTDSDFNDEFIVFDIETTGLSVHNCAITEIGAVKVKNGEVLEEFSIMTDPGMPIPEAITELTGITDEMVKGQPDNVTAVRAFLDFAGNRLLIAHNADFDTSFIRKVCESEGIPFPNPYLDTVSMSRYVNPELKKHKLDILADYFSLGSFNHHRATDDAAMLSAIFYKMVDKLRDEGIMDFNHLSETMSERADPLKLRTYHQIILAKNKVGLKNLYRLISDSYLTYYRRFPRIPKTRLTELREGLIIGSACEAGELFEAIRSGRGEAEIEEIASFYDYFEIQPIANNRFMIEKGLAKDEDELRDFNRRIVALGEKLGKPVCATCDSHYMDPEDEIYRRILLTGMKFPDADRPSELYMRTTEEMLREFSYLGEEKAYEVVVTNTNLVADMIEPIRPIPEGTYDPKIEGCEDELREKCYKKAKEMFGDPLPPQVSERLERELTSIIGNGFAVMYIIARRLVEKSEEWGYEVGSRGSVGSSFAAMMGGITKVNSLPPHYRCTDCLYTEWHDKGTPKSGFDLPPKDCPRCGKKNMHRDGHDIPFETFLGFYGDKVPDIDLNFSGDVQGNIHKYTEELFGKGHAFRAGTIGTLADKTAFGYVAKYLEGKGISVCRAEIERLIAGCVGVKRTTGQHPGGIIVVPQEYDVYDFCPVQHPADDPNSSTVTTHFEFKYLHDTILKLDELGHDIPTKYKRLEGYTNTSVLECDLSDRALYKLFTSPEPLGVTQDDLLGVETGTLGLPEMNTKFVRGVLIQAQPKNFSDLLQISGLTHGTGVWLGNADELIRDGICTISDVIGCRDDIMLYLIQQHDMDKAQSFKIMEDVRKGKGLKPEYEEAMIEHGVPDWYIESCKRIKYMFPKAHAAAYVIDALRLGWYKIYYPKEFYAAYFTAAPGGVEAETVVGGRDSIKAKMEEIDKMGRDATAKDKEMHSALQLCNEAVVRGIRFLPVDLRKSDATKFLPEAGGIRLPFSSIAGLGESAAMSIMNARDNEDIFSIEDLKEAGKLSKAVVELLDKNGVLKGMNETNQLSFGDMGGLSKPAPKKKEDKPKKQEPADSSDENSGTQLSFF